MQKPNNYDKNTMSEDEIDENLEESFPASDPPHGISVRIILQAKPVIKAAEMKDGKNVERAFFSSCFSSLSV
jgi:hypothetical protein